MSKTIMVIDDDPMNLRMAEFILKKNHFETILVSSGSEGIDKLTGGVKVDLLLLDIEMPGMNGIETLEQIRQEPSLKDLPVIFLTASSERDNVIDAGKLGAIGYVKKPFLPDDLIKRVNQAFAE